MKQLKEKLITPKTLELAISKGFLIKHLVTQSLLQKWIREVLHINIGVSYLPNINKWEGYYIPMVRPLDNKTLYLEYSKTCRTKQVGSYEKALSLALKQALLLPLKNLFYYY